MWSLHAVHSSVAKGMDSGRALSEQWQQRTAGTKLMVRCSIKLPINLSPKVHIEGSSRDAATVEVILAKI